MFDEITAIQEIRQGKKLTEFGDQVTPIMVLAAMSCRDAWDEIPENMRNRRFAKMAITSNYRNLAKVPEEMRNVCASAFSTWTTKITRKDLNAFMELFNAQDDNFVRNVLRRDPGAIRFVSPDRKQNSNATQVAKANATKRKKPSVVQATVTSFDSSDIASFDFASDAELGNVDELEPEAYLARPVERQTKEDLDALLRLDRDFPIDFIYRLQIPYRNEHFYRNQGDNATADIWKARQIPWLNRQVCEEIAAIHPEASVKTPDYLSKDNVMHYWQFCKENGMAKPLLTELFLLFPEDMEDASMLDDMLIDWRVLRHAPNICANTEAARLYLNREPNSVFRLPETFQTVTKLIADGTVLNAGNIAQIKNPELRQKIALAVGLEDQVNGDTTSA